METLGYILPMCDAAGEQDNTVETGAISAAYQNFLVCIIFLFSFLFVYIFCLLFFQVCIEMLFAAIALRYAFPISVYLTEGVVNSTGRSVTMQSISSSLKVRRPIRLPFSRILIYREKREILSHFSR